MTAQPILSLQGMHKNYSELDNPARGRSGRGVRGCGEPMHKNEGVPPAGTGMGWRRR